MDVGAGGLRFACRRRCPADGALVRLEILLQDPDVPGGPPRVVLDGAGRIVWVKRISDGEQHAGIAFDAPVDVRRSFPEIPVF